MFAPAIRNGLRFLVETQSSDGAWRDFSLEPGQSDSWVTAYVGGCLSHVPIEFAIPNSNEALNRAIQWLRGAMRIDGGWGYNSSCPVDSDSTALAVLLLRRVGVSLPEACFNRLLEFQKEDGGFATFERGDITNSWGISHPDVSPTVLRALLTKLPSDAPAITRGLGYCLSTLGPDGLWPSYWWTSPLYATLVNIQVLAQTGTPYNRKHVLRAVCDFPLFSDNAFEWAVLGETLAVLDPGNPKLVHFGRALADAQLPHGNWQASTPILRVSDPRSLTPWNEKDAGILVSDPNHLFTTATVLRFLSIINNII